MTIKTGRFSELEADIRFVRDGVFVDEQGWSAAEVYDEEDHSCVQAVAYRGDDPVGVARCWFDGGWHVGRVGVLREFRGRHIGVKIMQAVMEHIASLGGTEIHLHSQVERQGFYEGLGFEVCGDVYLQGKIEHVPMKR